MTKNLNLGHRRKEHLLISPYKKVSVADIMFSFIKGTMTLDKKKCGFGNKLAAPNFLKNRLNILFQFLHQIYGGDIYKKICKLMSEVFLSLVNKMKLVLSKVYILLG